VSAAGLEPASWIITPASRIVWLLCLCV